MFPGKPLSIEVLTDRINQDYQEEASQHLNYVLTYTWFGQHEI